MFIVMNENNKIKDLPEPALEYDPPYSKDQVSKIYGESVAERLYKDPAHKFRMDTGIELIHKEPTRDELVRICSNWLAMDGSMKSKSDNKSRELFGVDNLTHYRKLIKEYN